MNKAQYKALAWAVEMAAEWHGYYTGEPAAEKLFLKQLGKAQTALKELDPAKMSGSERLALTICAETDGCEVPRGMWRVYDKLCKRGLVSFGYARGPH